MSKYVEKNLIRDEKIELKAKVNPLYIIKNIIFAIIFIVVGIVVSGIEGIADAGTPILIVCLAIGIIILLVGILRLTSIALSVTNKRVIGKVGVLNVHSLDIHIDKVDSVNIKSTLFGRIFRYYTLVIKSAGEAAVSFPAISNATQFKNTVTEAIEKHADEARKAQAAEIAMAMNRGNKY